MRLLPAPVLALAAATACLCCCVSSPSAGLPESQMHPKFERKMAKVGDTVELKCHPHWKNGLSSGFKKHKATWIFQECGERYGQYPCPQHIEEGDINKPLHLCGKKLCRGNLLMNNVSVANSGMYQCVYPYGNKTADRKTIVSYILEVIETAECPQILEVFPENVTVLEGSQIIFSCKALSNVFAQFHWVRKYDSSSASQTIRYGDNVYEALNSSGQLAISEDTYIGKLNLPAAQQKDSRDYACVVTNSRGFVYREVHLTVLPRTSNNPVLGQGVDGSVHLLFLIPVIMVLVPTAAWFMCIYWRRRKKNEISEQIVTNSVAVQQNCKHNNNRSTIKYHIVNPPVDFEGNKSITNKAIK
ncbi:uncharacterized protein LOC126175175 isoform X1 [Schistocerca cancellata]|uniref:uncharacterized protein LOC126175175 isoform X1 n=1 Tax=Schistocerca cancellata TaxID=274614 RepID=UPI00211780D9|nr:uncharacterized protein LOC126175175 isoform X1 [Schistocerca cancellata]